ncbi:hypothetical protein CYY_010007 [Polysphondylium violaceum]|uniref:Uncharacterized protein n=1 Tax=Polysphondylium violaceum TaxID=133409 RepID=A0A8J4UUR1_9MYCE|nr:hypothetical protein CYY_010007 [Polysphondylium violaceum]
MSFKQDQEQPEDYLNNYRSSTANSSIFPFSTLDLITDKVSSYSKSLAIESSSVSLAPVPNSPSKSSYDTVIHFHTSYPSNNQHQQKEFLDISSEPQTIKSQQQQQNSTLGYFYEDFEQHISPQRDRKKIQ